MLEEPTPPRLPWPERGPGRRPSVPAALWKDLGGWGRRAVLCLAASSVLILLSAPAQYLGRQHDDILYVIAAQALSFGSYVLSTSPGTPPLTHVTPGFPLLLTPVVWLAGDWTPAYQIFCALLLAACPWVLWLWLRTRLGPTPSLLAVLLFGTSPIVLSQAGTVMPEGAYTLLAAALLAALERGGGAVQGRRDWTGPLLLLLTQLRPAGLSLLPAALARSWAQGRRRQALAAAAWPLMGLLAWSLWCAWARGRTQEMAEWAASYSGEGVARLLRLSLSNARSFLYSWGGCFLPASLGDTLLAPGLGLGLSALSLTGAVRVLRRSPWDPAVLMLAGALLMHAAWGWYYERYLIPLLPWLLWLAAEALDRKAAPVLAALLAAQTAFHSWRWLGETSWSKPELRQTYAWLAGRSRPQDVLASALYARDGFYAGMPNVPLPAAETSREFAAALKTRSVRRVLWQDGLDMGLSLAPTSGITSLLGSARRHLDDPSLFRLAYENPGEGSRVYEVR